LFTPNPPSARRANRIASAFFGIGRNGKVARRLLDGQHHGLRDLLYLRFLARGQGKSPA
jgi:hypothetical protein